MIFHSFKLYERSFIDPLAIDIWLVSEFLILF